MVRRPHVLPKFFDGGTVISFELGTSRHAHALYEARMTFGNQAQGLFILSHKVTETQSS